MIRTWRERGKNLQKTCWEPQGRDKNAVKSSRTCYGRTRSVVGSYREPAGHSADVVTTYSEVLMVCNRFVYHVHEDLTTFALRSNYVLQVLTTS